MAEGVADGGQDVAAGFRLAVGVNHLPGNGLAGPGDHLRHGGGVGIVLIVVAPVLIRQLIALGRVLGPGNEPVVLRLLINDQQKLQHQDLAAQEALLHGHNLIIGLVNPGRGRQFLNALHQDPAVIGPVKDGQMPLLREIPVEPPQVVVGQIIGSRRRHRRHMVAPRVHPPGQPTNGAPLAGRVRPLKNHHHRNLPPRNFQQEVTQLLLQGRQVPLIPGLLRPQGRRLIGRQRVIARRRRRQMGIQGLNGQGHRRQRRLLLPAGIQHMPGGRPFRGLEDLPVVGRMVLVIGQGQGICHQLRLRRRIALRHQGPAPLGHPLAQVLPVQM